MQGIRSSEKELLSKTIDDLKYEIKAVREKQAAAIENYEKARANEVVLQNALKKVRYFLTFLLIIWSIFLQAKEEYTEIKIAKDTLESRLNSISRDVEGKVNEKLQKMIESHNEEMSKLQTNYKIEQEMNQKLTQQISNLSEQLTQLRNTNESLRDDNEQLREKITKFQYSEKEFKNNIE